MATEARASKPAAKKSVTKKSTPKKAAKAKVSPVDESALSPEVQDGGSVKDHPLKGRRRAPEHNAKLTSSIKATAAVKAYLGSLTASRDAGRRDQLGAQVEDLKLQIRAARADRVPPTEVLRLIQKRLDIESQMRNSASRVELEQAFITHAHTYASRRGITRHAFREMGVPAKVLDEAGIR